jgi:hypothetical protein
MSQRRFPPPWSVASRAKRRRIGAASCPERRSRLIGIKGRSKSVIFRARFSLEFHQFSVAANAFPNCDDRDVA